MRDWDAGRRSCRALSVACGAQVDYYEFLRRLVVLRSSWRGVTAHPAEPRAVAEAREPAPRGGGGGPGSGPGGGGGGPGGGRGGYSLSAEMSKLEAALVAAAVARGGGGMLPVGEVKRLAALYRVSAPVRCSNESAALAAATRGPLTRDIAPGGRDRNAHRGGAHAHLRGCARAALAVTPPRDRA